MDFVHGFDALISPHGAQLTNMLFMPKCSIILELKPRGVHVDYYAKMAFDLGHIYGFVYNYTAYPIHARMEDWGQKMHIHQGEGWWGHSGNFKLNREKKL